MFVVAPKDVERGMPLFVSLFQVNIALGSFFGGQLVDSIGVSNLISLSTILVGIGIVTILVYGRSVSNKPICLAS
jgi:predicted MFS family arabinose efflux permease